MSSILFLLGIFTIFIGDRSIQCFTGHSIVRARCPVAVKRTTGFFLNSRDYSTEEVLENLFLRQLEDENLFSKSELVDDFFVSEHSTSSSPFVDANQNGTIAFSYPKKLVEEKILLEPGTPVEFVYKNRIMFGNFMSWSAIRPQSVELKTSSGDILNVDVGQIISSWDVLADELPPTDISGWAAVTTEALELLRTMSPRKSDLQEFAQLVQRQRSSTLPVDSLDLSVYIFQERKFRTWLNPYVDAAYAKVSAMSAAQRYAAAVLLFNDDLHFKRRQSILSQSDDGSEEDGVEGLMSEDSNQADSNTASIIEGGFKILEESVAMFRECEIFAEYYAEQVALRKQSEKTNGEAVPVPEESGEGKDKKKGSRQVKPFRAGCITRQLRAIEMYALSPSSLQPPRLVKAVLKRLGQPTTPIGARQVLLGLGRQTKFSVSQLRLTRSNTTGQKNKAASEAAGDKSDDGGYVLNITPWSSEVLESATALRKEVEERKRELVAATPGKLGKRGPSGKMDFRVNTDEHPPICIDTKYASFYDDAFSLSPATGELLVHVVDVVNLLRRQEPLRAVCKDRISSQFLPSGPLHMLPPLALEALKLSSSGPNEVITVALSVDYDSGAVGGFRIFPSIIGPVFPIDISTANEIIDGVGVAEDIDGNIGLEVSTRVGFSNAVVRDLRTVDRIVERVVQKQPWLDEFLKSKQFQQLKVNKRLGTVSSVSQDSTTGSSRIINTLLTLYSNSSFQFCQAKDIPVPIAWENRDKLNSATPRRFATQPLRNWIAQLQQKQLRAAMNMELPLSRAECALAVSHHNGKRRQMSSLVGRGREQMAFESFEAHCASVLSSGLSEVVLSAEGLGSGGRVKIKPFNLQGILSRNVRKGESLSVKVARIVPETKIVYLDTVDAAS